MARSGKCKVLVSNGVPSTATLQQAQAPSSGLRLEVGAPVWTEIAKTPLVEIAPREERTEKRAYRKRDETFDTDDPEIEQVDPRDVPLWRPQAFLSWTLQNYPWSEKQHRVVAALFAAIGDTDAVARTLKLDETYVRNTLIRAKSEVVKAAKRLDFEESFSRERLAGLNQKVMPMPRYGRRHLWFSGQPDLLCYLFDLDRRRVA